MRRRDILKAAGAAVLPGSFAIAQPASARTLRFVPQGGLTVLDPVFTTSPVTAQHGFAIYDTLFAVNARQEVRPQMAEGATFSDDGRTCLIRLRDELKFHNGEPVLAQDCVASLIRWTGRNLSGQAIAEQVDTWGTRDDRTIKITLKRRLPSLLSLLAGDSGFMPFIMPEHVAATSPFKQVTETIGSGPYRFLKDEFVPGSSAAYRRNELYVPRQEPPDASSGGKVAHFDRVEWNAMPDFATATAALRAGEVDWCEHVPTDLVSVLRRDPGTYRGEFRSVRLHRDAALQSPAAAVQQCRLSARGVDGGQSGRLHGHGFRHRSNSVPRHAKAFSPAAGSMDERLERSRCRPTWKPRGRH